MNLTNSTTNRKPRTINDRKPTNVPGPAGDPAKASHASSPETSPRPIRQHRAASDSRGIEPSEFTPHPEIQTLVRQLLLLDEAPSRVETHGRCGPALSVCEADAWQLRFTRVAEQDDDSCVECGIRLDVGDLALIQDDDPAGAIWCSTACAKALAWVERGTKGDTHEHA